MSLARLVGMMLRITACRSTVSGLVAHDEVDEVSLLQITAAPQLVPTDHEKDDPVPPMNPARHRRQAEKHNSYETLSTAMNKTEQVAFYTATQELLDWQISMSHSRHILQYVSGLPNAPTFPTAGGCLYLPSNGAWRSFYQHIEHPYPPLFAEMVANSIYPDCNMTSISGVRMDSCGQDRMHGSQGCFGVQRVGAARGIVVYESEGHIGLPGKWASHIERAKPNARRTVRDKCSDGSQLREIPRNERLVIPTMYIVCRSSDEDDRITREMIDEQARWTNQGYRGESPWDRMSFDDGHPPSVDMQIEFDVKDVRFVTDEDCAQMSFVDTRYAERHNPDPLRYFTVVIVSDDSSGILGMSQFPTETDEASNELLVIVSTIGLRHFALDGGDPWADLSYDEGDTIVHEAGHGLGLYHTFEGGCQGNGDMVEDTPAEEFPQYTCVQSKSCGSVDPVHNFMDYAPDSCMVGFTEGQKRRAWCVLEHYRSTLFNSSLIQ